ncbi:MAG: hypothetical protein BYD32DRAFT_464202 [Podila humilis]|nr:MAG: hypothetical protein BYD32DRAFT_464202 [Podila humilis]
MDKLPTEYLLGIVDMVGNDIATLRVLLTVNSFLFHASLPRLVEVWTKSIDSKAVRPSLLALKQFIALLVASIILYPGDHTPPSIHSVDGLFDSYGLQLSEKDTLVQSFPPIKEASKPTVDNTGHLTQALPTQFWFLPWLKIKHKFIPPPGHQSTGRLSGISLYGLARTLYPERITEMKLDMCSMHKYIAVMDKMVALTSLKYRQSLTVSDKYLQDLVQFIQIHTAAFPQKPLLEVMDYENGFRINVHGNEQH